jgi:hypothetical protein
MLEEPDSVEFKSVYEYTLSWLRLNEEGLKDPERLLDDLRVLLGGKPNGEFSSPEDATRLSEAYPKYYFHGAPFDQAALSSSWSRCRTSAQSREACTERAAVESKTSLELMVGGEEALEKFIDTCMNELRGRSPLCQQGQYQAGRILKGDLSDLENK